MYMAYNQMSMTGTKFTMNIGNDEVFAIVIFGYWNHHIFENRVQPQRGKTEWLGQVERIYILEQLGDNYWC